MPPIFFWFYPVMIHIPYSEQFNDIYFAVEDGLSESRYVFLQKNNLPEGWLQKDRFVIAETGFGTGLNFLCAWTEFEKTAKPHQKLHFYSFEKYPLSSADIQKYLAHWEGEFGGRLQKLIVDYPLRIGGWHTLRLSPQVTLTLIFDDVNRALPELNEPIDCWFLDGHAPAKNPDMWSDVVFQSIGRLSHRGTRFATFTAAGIVKRGLQAAGFSVSKERGFGRKRDMIIGVYEGAKERVEHTAIYRKIAVIGGGIAGAAVASALCRSGLDVTVFEKSWAASGGSGNIRGLINPKFTSQRGVEADVYAPAFALANRALKTISQDYDIGHVPCGSLHLITDEAKEKRLNGFVRNWGWHAEHAQLLTVDEAKQIAGVDLSHSALFLPDAAMVSPKILTEYLLSFVTVVIKEVDEIIQTDAGWSVDGKIFDAVVLAGGFDVQKFPQLSSLPLQKVRGQITRVKVNSAYAALKTNLCYGGYATSAFDGEAVIGSTFQHWIDSDTLRPEDDADNFAKLAAVAPFLVDGLDHIGARASFRCAAKDRIPVIGEVRGYDGLFVSAAHGSHGILSSLMGAELLAAKICLLGQILPRSAEKALASDRFRTA